MHGVMHESARVHVDMMTSMPEKDMFLWNCLIEPSGQGRGGCRRRKPATKQKEKKHTAKMNTSKFYEQCRKTTRKARKDRDSPTAIFVPAMPMEATT